MPPEHRHALPVGTRLEEYRIDRVLGSGGFGITYLAWDENLQFPVAIKEYLPADLAVREQNLSVYAKSTRDEEVYGWGLDRFREEAQMLARFDHPHIVRVLRFLTAHNTAYMVMQYEDGESLSAVLKQREILGENELRGLMIPLLDGLEAVHKAGVLHRDIKPANIYVRKDGSAVLLDFGAARQAIGERSRSMTAVLTAPYAPIEQYGKAQKQGPWTDIYAFGVLLYQAISGQLPPDATDRVMGDDTFEPTAQVARGRYSQGLFTAIDTALKPRGQDRPQTIQQWRNILWPTTGAAQPRNEEKSIEEKKQTFDEETEKSPSKFANARKIFGGVAALGLIGGVIWGATQIQRPTYESEFSAADSARARYDFSAAIDHYTKAITLNPFSAEAYRWRGNSYENQQKLDEAIDDINEAKQLDPTLTNTVNAELVKIYNSRAGDHLSRSEYTDAIADFTKATELSPNDAAIYMSRGDTYADNKQVEQAIADYTKAIQINPREASYYLKRGQTHYDNAGENYDTAITDFTKVTQLSPDDSLGYLWRGASYVNEGLYDKAITDLNKAIQKNADDAANYNWRGQAYYHKELYDKAIVDFGKAIQIASDDPENYYWRGTIFNMQGAHAKAVDDLSKAIELKSDEAQYWVQRGDAYVGLQRTSEAIHDYQQALSLDPDDDATKDSLKRLGISP